MIFWRRVSDSIVDVFDVPETETAVEQIESREQTEEIQKSRSMLRFDSGEIPKDTICCCFVSVSSSCCC